MKALVAWVESPGLSITVALMSHDCLDETLCAAEVIQSGRFFYAAP